MSRIAGIVSGNPAFDLSQMLEVQSTLGDWRKTELSLGDFRIGFVGTEGETSALRRDGIMVVVDGAIYNAGSLGTGTPAEILLTLYRKHGFSGMLCRLNGDFSIAIHDAERGELWLGRDRFGIRPLYFAVSRRGEFAFASRIRSLLTLPFVSGERNHQYVALVAASHYRHFDNDSSRSPYRDIEQLEAGSWLCWKNGGRAKGRYWDLVEVPDLSGSEEDLAQQYRDLLVDATRIRLDAARNPGFTLSGGMDSSSVISAAVSCSGRKQEAYSSVYKDRTYDESEDIRTILDHAVSTWNQVDVSEPDVFSLIEKMVAVNDEPVATATWLSHYEVCRTASTSGVTHLFGGLGGDELNAGEYEHFFPFFADLKVRGRKSLLESEVSKWVEHHDHPIHRKSFQAMEETVSRTCDLSRPGVCLPDRIRLEKYHSLLNRDYYDLAEFEPVMDRPFQSYLKNRCFQDIFRETSPCCLRAQDRQGMAFGIRHVMPFFDHRVAEFMFRVPGDLKFRNGVTKVLLRKAMEGLVPSETRNRIKKTGWNAPAHLWFCGKAAEPIRDLLRSTWFRDTGIYNIDKVEKIVDEHCGIVERAETAENHMMLLWQLVNLAAWLKH